MTTTDRLRRIVEDESTHPEIRKVAERRLKVESKRAHDAACMGNLGRYKVNGVWKLTHRIADFDPEGDVINGWSDRL